MERKRIKFCWKKETAKLWVFWKKKTKKKQKNKKTKSTYVAWLIYNAHFVGFFQKKKKQLANTFLNTKQLKNKLKKTISKHISQLKNKLKKTKLIVPPRCPKHNKNRRGLLYQIIKCWNI